MASAPRCGRNHLVRGGCACRRRGDRRLRARPTTRTSRRPCGCRRILLFQQRRAGRHEVSGSGRRASGDRRLGRASRERHADLLLRQGRRADDLAAHATRELGAGTSRDGFSHGIGTRERSRAQCQHRAEAGQRRRRVLRGVPTRRRAGARAVSAGCADRRERSGCERVRCQRQDEREHGRLSHDRTKPARERPPYRLAPSARAGGRLRADIRCVLPARDARGGARYRTSPRGPARVHARRPDARK